MGAGVGEKRVVCAGVGHRTSRKLSRPAHRCTLTRTDSMTGVETRPFASDKFHALEPENAFEREKGVNTPPPSVSRMKCG